MIMKATIANRKLVTGPAATMMKRCQSGLAWKVCARSAGGQRQPFVATAWLAGFMSPANLT